MHRHIRRHWTQKRALRHMMHPSSDMRCYLLHHSCAYLCAGHIYDQEADSLDKYSKLFLHAGSAWCFHPQRLRSTGRQDSLLDEVVASAEMRCVEPVLMDPWGELRAQLFDGGWGEVERVGGKHGRIQSKHVIFMWICVDFWKANVQVSGPWNQHFVCGGIYLNLLNTWVM